MIDLYFWPTPNGYKIALYLEETGLDYRVIPVDIGAGDQFKPEFLAFSPNNRMPAIVDHAPVDGDQPQTVFESGAILHYLATKTGQLWPTDPREQIQTMEWLMWQMGGLGPMAGQNHHFNVYAPETIPYAQKRYTDETSRLYGVLNKRLEGREFIVGAYGIADIACYPWVNSHERQKQDLNDFPHLKAWYERIKAMPSTQRAYAQGEGLRNPNFTPEEKALLFGQNKDVVK
ncbi:MAG: glutathione binding-like protein [Litorivicinus sp.]